MAVALLLSSNRYVDPPRVFIEVLSAPMTPASQAHLVVHESSLPAPAEIGLPGHPIHAPRPGVTATFINDMRELFKVRVTGLVVITGWAGFYLGSMQSGISSVQRGLLDTLIGIGLV